MKTLRGIRRWIGANVAAIAFVVVLAIPAVVAIRGQPLGALENRGLAQLSANPKTWTEALKYTESVDRWINDHFGFRYYFVRLNNRIRYILFREFPTIQVIAGREGRIFLSAHATNRPPFSAIMAPCGYVPANAEDVAESLDRFISTMRARGLDAHVLIAPSSPVLYAGQLPRWLEKTCAASIAPIPAVLASPRLEPRSRAFVYYPIAELRRLQQTMEVFPKTWFHWSGAGPRAVAGLSTEHFWGIDARAGRALATSNLTLPSDISHMFPGVVLSSEVLVADYAKSDVMSCHGPQCFPDLAGVAAKLIDVATYRNHDAPAGRLIVISDSFGRYIAGWYARYFKEVVHISTNTADRLDAEELAQLRGFLHSSQDVKLLFVYHDGAVLEKRQAQDLARLAP